MTGKEDEKVETEKATEQIIRLFQGESLEFAVRDNNFPDEEFWIQGSWVVSIIAKLVLEAQKELDK